jgi:hypothetical protein
VSRTLLTRVLAEWRRVIVPLAVILGVNVLVYALGVYPLAQRVANVEERNRRAADTLAEARKDFEAARNTLVGKERAETELVTFYRDLLPTGESGVRRLVYPRLSQLARQSGLSAPNWKYEIAPLQDSTLSQATIDMVLRGPYSAVRTFLYQLETAPEFLVTQDVSLAEGSESETELVLTIQLVTYFRTQGS